MSDKEGPASSFNRFAGLPPGDRRAYNLIVEGRGHLLVRESGAVDGDLQDDDTPRSGLLGRYLAGVRLLQHIGLIVDDPSQPPIEKPSVVLLTSETARSLTIVFSGNNQEFALPAHLLAAHDTHLLLIHDRRRCFALAGLPGLGDDYEACLASLTRIRQTLKPDSLHILGISAGGGGAIKFACDMQAEQLVCFSVPTTLNLDDDPGAELKHYPQLTKLYRHDRSLGIDLAAYYDGHLNRPNAIFVYSEGHPRDSWLALRMSGIRGVTLLPTEGYSGHTTYRWLLSENKIAPFLDMLYPAKPGEDTPAADADAGKAAGVGTPSQGSPQDQPQIVTRPLSGSEKGPGLLQGLFSSRLQVGSD